MSLSSVFDTIEQKLVGDTEGFVEGLVQTAAADIVAAGATTASFIAAGKDILAQVEAKGLSFLMQEIMALLNIATSALVGNSSAPSAPAADSPSAAG